jgi:hypothetical protein
MVGPQITKQEAAQRQIDAAIRMLFLYKEDAPFILWPRPR